MRTARLHFYAKYPHNKLCDKAIKLQQRKNLNIDELQRGYSAQANLGDDLLAGGQP